MELEAAGECLRGAEADSQRCLQDGQLRLGNESECADLEPPAPEVVAERFAHPGSEQAVEVKRGEECDRHQPLQVERLVEVPIDMLQDTMHPGSMRRAAVFRHGR